MKPGPWREVGGIEERTGAKGGKFWKLTLEPCGHLAFRPVPLFVFGRRPRLAPHRVRCLHCALKTG